MWARTCARPELQAGERICELFQTVRTELLPYFLSSQKTEFNRFFPLLKNNSDRIKFVGCLERNYSLSSFLLQLIVLYIKVNIYSEICLGLSFVHFQ